MKIRLPSVIVLLMSVAIGQTVWAGERIKFDIPPQALSQALFVFSEQANMTVLSAGEDLKGKVSSAVKGEYAADEALRLLLGNSGVGYEFKDTSTLLIRAKGVEREASVRDMALAQAATSSSSSATGDGTQPTDQDKNGSSISEIIVTAQKRLERLQDVPVPVTAINTDTLVGSNQLRLQDYYTRIPGLNLTITGNTATPAIAIRGVVSGNGNPTVGTVVDDVPFTPSTGNGLAADFDPGELSRVEVLRGPQGTLYGASSMGGLLKFVTVDPSTDRFGGRVQVGTSSVYKGDELGYSLRGSVNMPVGDTFAVRASGSTRRDPGYIDNLRTGQEDINVTDAQTARVAALWRPTDDFSLKLNALYQRNQRDGSPVVTLPSPLGPRADLSDLQQSVLANTGLYDEKFQAYSATIKARLGRSEVTSVSGYNINQLDEVYEQEAVGAGLAPLLFAVAGADAESHGRYLKFSQELRLSTPIGDRIEWLLGAFYTRERYELATHTRAINPATAAFAGTILRTDNPGSFVEYAAFTNLAFQMTERFDIQVGGRISRNEFEVGQQTITGIANTALFRRSDPFFNPAFESKENVFTYLVTPRFKVSPDLMVYARLASGYRPGGPNRSAAALAAGFPRQFDADTARNYELGVKGAFFEQRLSFDASLYHIDWRDVQVQLRDAGNDLLSYTDNAAAAKSEGVELTVEFRPLGGLTISAWSAYNDAKFTDIPPTSVVVRSGDRLPYGARRSGNLSIDREFALWNNASGFVGSSLSYVGDRKGTYFANAIQGTFPAYTQIDMRVGAHFDLWSINAYVNNLADKRGVLRSGRDAANNILYAVTYNQPRIFGISLTRTF